MTAILPCNDLGASVAFYERLGFTCTHDHGDYKLLSDGLGGALHLAKAAEGWVVPDRNPFGLYLYIDDVDAVQERMGDMVLHRAKDQPWGMYEFAMSDPDGTLVRVGRLSSPAEDAK